MKRNSIYYQIFKRFPALIFELVDDRPQEAQNYRFESVEVKETSFRIDGVFLDIADEHINFNDFSFLNALSIVKTWSFH